MAPHRRSDAARPLRVLLRRPLLVGLAALVAVTTITLGLVVLVVTVLGTRVDRANEMLSALQDGHVAMINQETGLRGFLVTREQRFLQPYWKGSRDLELLDARLEQLVGDDAVLGDRLAPLYEAQRAWIERWAAPVLVEQPTVDDTAALDDLLSQDKRLFDAYREVQAEARAAVEQRRGEAITGQRVVLLGGAVLGLLVAGGVAVAVRRANRRLAAAILPPTQVVRDTLAGLTAGQLDSRAPEAGPAELRDIAGDVNELAAALRDRSELVAAREAELVAARDQAEQAGQAKTAFLATMSHEIRTPLNAVLGLTDLLLTTELTDEQRGHLETIAGSGDALLTLINDVLDFSKIEAGELDLDRAPFDLHALAYDVAQLLAPQAAGKGLDLLVDIPGNCPAHVVGDGSRLRQVVLNLVGNAVKFTSSGQVVLTVLGEVRGGSLHCRIAVADTGIGIPADQQHRLFRSFSQVDTSTTRSYGGTGLGLAISQRITRAMGGDITVDSAAGRGSTFTVAVDLELSSSVPVAADPRALAGLRLLVVDDNPTNLRILEHQLGRAGAAVVAARSGAEALGSVVADDGRFDAAVLDLHMPGMDGDELARRLGGLPGGAALPLLLLSSSAPVHAERAAHFTARLHKPVRPERLVHAVRSVVHGAGPGAAPAPAAGPAAGPAVDGRRPLRVLVAEDHAVNAQLVGLYLRQLGHDCEHVANGELAVDAVRTGSFDVVLMDAQMPVLGGVDATAAIRALPVAQPRVLALTASVLTSDRTAFLEAGADDFLTKPVRLATLADALDRWAGAGAPTPPAATAGGAGPAAGAALDAGTVAELRDLGPEAFGHLYRQYAAGLEGSVRALLAAAEGLPGGADDEVARLAHRLKGSSAAMGASALAELCRRVEETADPAVLPELADESRRVHAAVTALLDG
ncbi:response regulator [Geodermatophilus sp. YIM 151500]|uniref:hybrid sensor histidine kinase/response regulator n=1 Tax=Geodermatophilus sp. YIM 151500 TaxID=2984531 RepID=UPI0021E4C46C|nr:response regulator [Geodermatophilus sp. YIM 151500]MCV2490586.1 response regulator [Geodermatophilus sp. YIM 151500]